MTNSCCYKYQLADKLEISRRTLAYWLNRRYFAELEKMGYRKTQKYLTPEHQKFLSNKLGFEL